MEDQEIEDQHEDAKPAGRMGIFRAAGKVVTDANARAKEQGEARKQEAAVDKQRAAAAVVGRGERDRNPATRWEYRAVHVGKDKQKGWAGSGRMESIFNKLGAHGWELVAIHMERATFKREVKHMSSEEIAEFAALPAVPDDDGED